MVAFSAATAATIVAYAAITTAAATTAATVYSLTKGTPTLPTPHAPMVNPPPVPVAPPSIAPGLNDADTADSKARAAAARKQRDMESRRSGSSTVLTSPLGVSTPTSNVQSTVLGR